MIGFRRKRIIQLLLFGILGVLMSIADVKSQPLYGISSCLECASSPLKRFREEIIVGSMSGETWTVVPGSVVGLYVDATSLMLVSGNLSIGNPNTNYILEGWRDSDSTYNLKVTNMTDTLTVFPINICSFPDTTIYGDDDVCVNSTHAYTLNIPNSDIIAMEWNLSNLKGSFESNGNTTLINNSNSVTINFGGMAGNIALTASGTGTYGCHIDAILDILIIDENDVSLTCNDLVHVSLEDHCEAIITPDIILEGQLLPNSSYDVILYDPDDNSIIPNATLTRDYLGRKITVSIEHECSFNSCWGKILVEDKIPPEFTDCVDGFLPDVTIECTDDIHPDFGPTEYPEVIDNCDESIGPGSLTWIDLEISSSLCEDGMYSSIVKRTWTAMDSYGNKSSCMEMIYVHRTTLFDIIFPGDTILSCDLVLIDYQMVPVDHIEYMPNGNPSPETTGKPIGLGCKNIQYNFQDIIFDLCGSGKKVYRTWTVIDWCTGMERIEMQVIKIEDTMPPIVVCVQDTLRYPTDPGKCTGTIDVLPDPVEIFDCSMTSYTIAYKLKDDSGDPYDLPITDNVIDNGDGTFGIKDLPVDTTWVVYTVVDECGFESQCFTEVVIYDGEDPSAICEAHTVVALNDLGWAEIWATSLDDHSYDNCGIDRFEAKRLLFPDQNYCNDIGDFSFEEKLHFCCADIGDILKVVLRVYDESENYTECLVHVTVQDKFPPVILCPPKNVTLQCDENYTNINLTGGEPEVEDNCPENIQISYEDYENLNSCGTGTVTRIWTIFDGQKEYYCSQTITIDGNTFGKNDIIWPPDHLEINGCSPEDAPIELTGKPKPKPGKDVCVNLAYTHKDQLYYDEYDFCMKLLRVWTVIDWCSYDKYDPGSSGIWVMTQKILLNDYIPPTFISDCSNRLVDADSPNCEGYIELMAQAIDNCSGAITYSFEVDIDFNPFFGFQPGPKVNGNDASGVYPVGTHRIRFTAKDVCGNTNFCEFNFTIKDNKAPSPICNSSLSFPLPLDGAVTIWASEFEASSFDNCDGTDLFFSFSQNTFDQSRIFTCLDLTTNGAFELVPLEVWVSDQDGNQAFCSVTAQINDNKDICPDINGLSANVSGLIMDEDDEGLAEVKVMLSNMDKHIDIEGATVKGGTYSFQNLDLYSDYVVEPEANTHHLNGVSTLDMVLIQQHILGMKKLSSPYRIIAADVNGSGTISAVDLLALRRLILGISDTFPNNTSWKFIDAHFEFPDKNHPFDFPEKYLVEDLFENQHDADFIAVKIGDVSGNASFQQYTNPEVRSSETLELVIEQKGGSAKELEIQFLPGTIYDIRGIQFTISFDPEIAEFVAIKPGQLEVNSNNYNAIQSPEGLITFSWHDNQIKNLEKGLDLFSLYFKQLGKDLYLDDFISITSDITQKEAVNSDFESIGISYSYGSPQTERSEFQIFQNYPNPFSELTTIGFVLPEPGEVILKIYDVQGKLVFSHKEDFETGFGEFEIEAKQIKSEGIMYYQLETDHYKATRRMVIIR